jgi:hypothetical protein
MEKRVNIPKKGAGRRLANKLEELGKQPPPKELVDKINNDGKKKVAIPKQDSKDLEV